MNNDEIDKWVLEISSKYCSDCQDSCCNAGSKNIIIVTTHETENMEQTLTLFKENGIPVYPLDSLDLTSVHVWRANSWYENGFVNTKDEKRIEKPAIIECPEYVCIPSGDLGLAWFEKNTQYIMYVDEKCPFYSEDNRCMVHEDSRRPDSCKTHPVSVKKGDREEQLVYLDPNCEQFNRAEVIEDFNSRFQDNNYRLVVQ